MPQQLTITKSEPLSVTSAEPLTIAKSEPTFQREIRASDGVESGGIVGALKDFGIGASKGAANTVVGLGELAYEWLPGVGLLSRAIHGDDAGASFDAARSYVQPTNTAQKVGFGVEQIGEFFVPGGAVTRAARGSRVARAGLEAATAAPLASAQGASRGEAGATAALSAVVPAAGAAMRGTRNMLTRGAEKNMTQALGAGKEWAKEEAATLAPEMLRRGIGGTRESMLEAARSKVKEVGAQIGKEVDRAAKDGATVDGQAISGYIAAARSQLTVQTQNAVDGLVPIPGTERVIRQLNKLDSFVESLGPNIPFDRAAKIKTVWDKIVSKAGLYGPKAAASATDSADAWAIREAADGFRRLLALGSSTLDELNAEYAFWKGMKSVLKETAKRTQAQGGGLVSGVTGTTGAATGFMSGGDMSDKVQNALIGGVAGRQLVRLMQSPWFRSQAAAPMKDRLARALSRGDQSGVSAAIARMVATLPSTSAVVR